MNFKQWLSNQTPKTFVIKVSTSGKYAIEVKVGMHTECEIDNLTAADLQALQQVLNQQFPTPAPQVPKTIPYLVVSERDKLEMTASTCVLSASSEVRLDGSSPATHSCRSAKALPEIAHILKTSSLRSIYARHQ
jgi:hypothetical protein